MHARMGDEAERQRKARPTGAAKPGPKIWAPPGKSARVVAFSGFEGCGCGGTHVKNTSEIGKVSIRKIKVKKGVTRIAYAIVLA